MATLAQTVQSEGLIVTMAQVLQAESATQDFYYAVKVNNVVYAITKQLVKEQMNNPNFQLKVSKSGQWLVANTTNDFKLNLTIQ